jgi:copper(I)-binding protein
MRIALSAALLLTVAGCSQPTRRDANVEVENAWVRLPALPGRPAAAYLHIRTDVDQRRWSGSTARLPGVPKCTARE